MKSLLTIIGALALATTAQAVELGCAADREGDNPCYRQAVKFRADSLTKSFSMDFRHYQVEGWCSRPLPPRGFQGRIAKGFDSYYLISDDGTSVGSISDLAAGRQTLEFSNGMRLDLDCQQTNGEEQ